VYKIFFWAKYGISAHFRTCPWRQS